jgi:FkbM family methyltransferase
VARLPRLIEVVWHNSQHTNPRKRRRGVSQSARVHAIQVTTRPLAFDVGLNTGDDTRYLLSRGYRVVAIDADPRAADTARATLRSEIQEGRLEIIHACIAREPGVAEFWICDDKSQFNSFHRAIASRDGRRHHKIDVPAIRFASILERFGIPHLLKIDIEGNDLLCLEDLSPSALPRFVSIESECAIDPEAASVDDGLRVLAMLRDLGYRKFKLIDQLTFCALAVPSLNHTLDTFARRVLLTSPLLGLRGSHWLAQRLMVRPTLERRFGHTFAPGCSGALGDDTPGRWIDYAHAARAYRRYRAKHFDNPAARPYSFWCDWHAKM